MLPPAIQAYLEGMPMKAWLNWKAFFGAAVWMAVVQRAKLAKGGVGDGALIEAIMTVVFGGLFWGVIATYVDNRFYKK